jgi:hypothetical protein
MSRTLEGRIVKLEQYRAPRKSYVIFVSDPPTAAEQAELDEAAAEGRKVAVIPHKCETVEEWIERYAPK